MATKRTPGPLVRFPKLLVGEGIDAPTEEPSQLTDDELSERYRSGKTRMVTESARYPLSTVLSMLEEEVGHGESSRQLRYDMDPDYQRRHRWDDSKKSLLIESFLMNVPIPPVFLYEEELSYYEVMDGKQRLSTLAEFYRDEFALTGLQYWAELNGRTYSGLPPTLRQGIDRRYISAIILLKETASSKDEAARLKKIVFERLNSGGVRLSHQETRNAIYDGPLNRL